MSKKLVLTKDEKKRWKLVKKVTRRALRSELYEAKYRGQCKGFLDQEVDIVAAQILRAAAGYVQGHSSEEV